MNLLIDLHRLGGATTRGSAWREATALLAAVAAQAGEDTVLVLLGDSDDVGGLLAAREVVSRYITADAVAVVPSVSVTGAEDVARQRAAREAMIGSLGPRAVVVVDPDDVNSAASWSAGEFLPAPPTVVAGGIVAGPADSSAARLMLSDPAGAAAAAWSLARQSHPDDKPDSGAPSLALVSPWPPARSGIADFAASTLPHLLEHYEITVVTDSPWTDNRVPHISRAVFREEWWRYDRVLYHVGNNAYHAQDLEMLGDAPGAVIVHDAVLSGAIRSSANAFGHPGGVQSLLAWDGPDPGPGELDLRGTRAALAPALGVLVHSEHARDLLREAGLLTDPLDVSPLPVTRSSEASHRSRATTETGIPVLSHFGFVNAHKGAEELVEAAGWLIRHGRPCRVAFVGEFLDRPLRTSVTNRAAELDVPIEITGFVTPEEWTGWLERSACAVQLRQQSHGESSAALGELLVAGLPVICTDTGSFAELPEGVVRHVPRGVDGEQLAAVIASVLEPDEAQRLGRASQEYADSRLSPSLWAAAVADMVEQSYATNLGLLWARATAGLPPAPAPRLPARSKSSSGDAVWLSDTSVYAHTPFFSGIQRVTLGLHRELLAGLTGAVLHPTSIVEEPPDGPHPEIATDRLLSRVHMPLDEADWLLCLDLDVRLARIRDELLAARARGLRVCVNVYDLMPVLHPEWFPHESGPDGFAPWLRVMLETADLVLVNSVATGDQLRDWVRAHTPDRVDSFDLALLRLGAGVTPTVPAMSRGLRSANHFVMVGTVEPRKGHAEVLDAFEKLWADGSQVRLTVVGRAGWMVQGLTRRMEALHAQDDRFRWEQSAPDEALQTLYARCAAVIMASEGEGFGLPIIEAAVHGCPVVVRDLPVFREIAGDSATYFRADGSNLAEVLEQTQRAAESGQLPLPSTEHVIPWRDVANRLTALLRGTEPMLDRWSAAGRAWSGQAS